jgi:hypothetical protein
MFMSAAEKKRYRAAIRVEWRKVVARGRFTSHEYKLIDDWFDEGVEIEVIVRAIQAALFRANSKGLTIYSLGFVKSDVMTIRRARARMHVGGNPQSAIRNPQSGEAWRDAAHEALTEMADDRTDPERAAMLRELVTDIPKLSRSQVEERFRAIIKK